jgi:3-ketosteroid 9alpha-monooxygenase subunit B
MSILKSVVTAGTGRVVLCYANRDERSVIFATELRELAARHADRLTTLHWRESIQGLPTRAQLAGFANIFRTCESFICGPTAYMVVVQEALSHAGVPQDRIHVEVFQSLTGDPFTDVPAEPIADETDAADAEIQLDGELHTLRWPRSRNLVDTMLAAGTNVPFSCREGNCGSARRP